MKEHTRRKIKNFVKWLFLDFSGYYFVKSKVSRPNAKGKRSPSTLFLWLIGIYVAFFGVASNRYENRIDIIENRANAIFVQLSLQEIRKKALSRMTEIQNMPCPMKPEFLYLYTPFASLVFNKKYDDMVELMKTTLEDWKDKLGGVNLLKANLQGAGLVKANLQFTNLYGANLQGAILWGARLKGSKLEGANLKGAQLHGAWLREANLRGAILQGAILKSARLERAENLTADQLCEAKTLYRSELDPELKKEVKEKCPQLLEKPKEQKAK